MAEGRMRGTMKEKMSNLNRTPHPNPLPQGERGQEQPPHRQGERGQSHQTSYVFASRFSAADCTARTILSYPVQRQRLFAR